MADEYLHRTAITRLSVTPDQAERLRDVIDAWQAGCELATDYAWPDVSSARAIQSGVYDRIRTETGLKSEHTLLVCHNVADTLRSLRERRTAGQRVSKPTFRSPTVTYDGRTMTLFDDGTVSLTTLSDRVRAELVLPRDDEGYQFQYLDDDRWELTESTLTARDGGFYLHLGFRRPRPNPTTSEHRTVLGVDLGVTNLAVTSTGRFFSGGELFHEQSEAIRRQRELQQTGTRSAYRTIGELRARTRRRGRDCLHRVANGIIEEATEHECTTIAVEDLTGIRDQADKVTVVHRWAFRTLVDFVRYRAADHGIEVELVDPAHTSQRCSRLDCGYVDEENRPQRDQFCCQQCGYSVAADYNAAKNIGLRCVRRGHTSSRRTGVGQCALKSGTLSPTEEFTDKSTTG